MSPTSVPAFADPSLPLPVIPVLSSHINLVFTPPIILSSREELVFIPAAPPTTVKLIPQPAHCKSTLQPAHHPVPESSSTDDDDDMSDGASLESSLTSLESGTIKIPKPEEEAGRPGRGGYNLKAQLAWNPATFSKLKKFVHHSVKNHLDATQCKSRQRESAATIVNSDDEGGEEPEESGLPPAPPSTQGQVDGDANLTATAASASISPGNLTASTGTSPGTSPGNPTATAASAGTSPGNLTTTATRTGASPSNLTASTGTSPTEQTATAKNTSAATTANPAMMDSTLNSDIHGILPFGGTKQQVFDDLVESILNFDGASIGLY
ncbi:hypothetical protein SCLCIDRAFT_23549 [Scleroderma citrinum Foug A]|uniref:Uncharacterized protein n=1 Tax=Scleroderma citrinum Foug A TaxID=1036808 RepID=A0A0C3AH24_9AGAM|nr:hypothetical protein SCLCIDRAFT_23549 [Scleroderma citrinum Foug A]